MKVGVDAVLLGSWIDCKSSKRILDVGTGCGIIALLLAQRTKEAEIDAIDIDVMSVGEATLNFRISPWSERLRIEKKFFPQDVLLSKESYDLIVSNPPYFLSGITKPTTRREKARHQGSLSVYSLLENAPSILKEGGRLGMIFPKDFLEPIVDKSKENGFIIRRLCYVRDNEKRPEKRVMIDLEKTNGGNSFEMIEEHLTLFEGSEPSAAYREMCRDMYIKF